MGDEMQLKKFPAVRLALFNIYLNDYIPNSAAIQMLLHSIGKCLTMAFCYTLIHHHKVT